VEHDAADELDVEVAQPDGAPGGLAAEREGFDQQIVQVLLLRPLAQLVRPGPQRGVVQLLKLGPTAAWP